MHAVAEEEITRQQGKGCCGGEITCDTAAHASKPASRMVSLHVVMRCMHGLPSMQMKGQQATKCGGKIMQDTDTGMLSS
jgi:hypothetical protein